MGTILVKNVVKRKPGYLYYVDVNRVECIRSFGSSTRRTLARCHTLGKLMQKAMRSPAHYAIEFLEIFEKLSKEEQDKVIIHELMHIPKTFGGGFRQHDFVCEENVEIMYNKFVSSQNKNNVGKEVKDFNDFENNIETEVKKKGFFW